MSRRGFTLLEILVATAILALILMSVYGVLSRALQAKDHAEERADLYTSGREAVLRIADEIEGALPPTAGNGVYFFGAPGKEKVPTDMIQFATVIRRDSGGNNQRGGRALVSYSLDPEKDQSNVFLLRREEQTMSPPELTLEEGDEEGDGTGTEESEDTAPPVLPAAHILENVAALRFKYLVPDTDEWIDAWDTTVTPEPGKPAIGLPGAVEITLYLYDAQGGTHDFGTIVDLPLMTMPPTPGIPR